MILSEMYACITYVSEIQFKPKIKVLQDWSFFPSYHYIDDIINRRHHESQSIHASLSSNNNIITEKKRILLVDDEPDLANLYKLSLERDGFFVEIFNDPLLALSRYKAGAYDLLLLDINMPRMNGFKLYQEILLRHLDRHVKVCFITAFEEYDNQFKELFPGLEEADCFIRKPIALKALTEKVKSRLQ
jgi:two-component system alkaline phosphatase synthesis response regulator PhoP